MTSQIFRRFSSSVRRAPPAMALQRGQDTPQGFIENSVCHALALLGMGVEGVSCGGDFTAPQRTFSR